MSALLGTDLLAGWQGLEAAPRPGTSACDQLIDELCFALNGVETVVAARARVLRFMIGRGFWPLGTRWDQQAGWVFPTRACAA